MNRFVKTSVLLLTLSFSLSACHKAENISFEKEMTIDVSNLGIDVATEIGPLPFKFNLEDYAIIEDEPNMEKAKLSILFEATIGFYSKVKVNEEGYKADIFEGYERLYNYFQLEDLQEYVTLVESDTYDTSKIQMAHHLVKSNGTKYDIVFCTLLDSSNNSTWASNFDMGYDDESYYSKTGEHPEWTEKDNHKGFDIAANRSVEKIESYLSHYKSGKTQQIVYVFGHSRGGAIGNLVAKKLIDKGRTVVAYTSASPLTTMAKNYNDAKYNHIFNFVNDVDPITVLPSSGWGFNRFGKDYHFDVKNYGESFKRYSGQDLPEFQDISMISTLLTGICAERKDAYVFDEKYTIATSKALDDQAAVDKYINEQKNKFSGKFKPLQSFLKFDVKQNDDNKYVVNVVSCAALISHLLGYALATYGLSNAITSVALTYYYVISAYAKLAGIDNPMSLRDDFDGKSLAYAHYYYSYVAYFFA